MLCGCVLGVHWPVCLWWWEQGPTACQYWLRSGLLLYSPLEEEQLSAKITSQHLIRRLRPTKEYLLCFLVQWLYLFKSLSSQTCVLLIVTLIKRSTNYTCSNLQLLFVINKVFIKYSLGFGLFVTHLKTPHLALGSYDGRFLLLINWYQLINENNHLLQSRCLINKQTQKHHKQFVLPIRRAKNVPNISEMHTSYLNSWNIKQGTTFSNMYIRMNKHLCSL